MMNMQYRQLEELKSVLFPRRELKPDEVSLNLGKVSPSYKNVDTGRRRFVGKAANAVAKAAVAGGGLYLLSQVPQVLANLSEIDVGLLSTPVKFDGQVGADEYSDCNPYQYSVLIPCAGNPVGGKFYTKYDDPWQHFGMTSPSDTQEITGKYVRYFSLWFNTQNQPTDASGTPGILTFDLRFDDPHNPHEIDVSEGTGYGFTSFLNGFKRGEDYDWKYFFGPCTQLEFKVKKSILTKNYPEIGIETYFDDYQGNLMGINGNPTSTWTNMVYKDIPLPEPFVVPLITGLAAATYLAKRVRGKSFTRRALFGLPTHPLGKE